MDNKSSDPAFCVQNALQLHEYNSRTSPFHPLYKLFRAHLTQMYVIISVIDGSGFTSATSINTNHSMVAHAQPIFNRRFYRGTSIATLAYSVPLNMDCHNAPPLVRLCCQKL